jgi:hypothetical protein
MKADSTITVEQDPSTRKIETTRAGTLTTTRVSHEIIGRIEQQKRAKARRDAAAAKRAERKAKQK